MADELRRGQLISITRADLRLDRTIRAIWAAGARLLSIAANHNN